MSALITQRFHRLADSVAELKVKVRAALASELAGAVGTAVRDVLVVAMLDPLVAVPARPSAMRPPPPRTGGWREEDERDRWGEPTDSWSDDNEYDRSPVRYGREGTPRGYPEPTPAVPAAAAVVVGVNVGRWWLARKGTVATAVGFGVLAMALGLAGGPVARAALAVLSAATDVLTAESALARTEPS